MAAWPELETYTDELVIAKAKAHFPQNWKTALADLRRIDEGYLKTRQKEHRNGIKLCCLFLAASHSPSLTHEIDNANGDERDVMWPAGFKLDLFVAWISNPDAVSKGWTREDSQAYDPSPERFDRLLKNMGLSEKEQEEFRRRRDQSK
jgi:hypothetical protein